MLLSLSACTSSAERAQKEAALAQLLLEQGNLPFARAAIGRALALGGNSFDILLLDARIKLQSQQVREAYDAYRTVLVYQPDNLEALAAVARTGAVIGEQDVARDAIRKGLAAAPNDPELLLTLGVIELGEGKFPEAARHADQILASARGDPRGLALKSRALNQMGRGDEALALLLGEVSRTGNNSLIAGALLETARSLGKGDVMLEQFPLLISEFPQSSDLALDEINVRFKLRDTEGVRAASRDFITKFGTDSPALARLYELWQEYDRPVLNAQDIAELAQSGPVEARLMIARYYLDRNDPATAAALVANSPDPRAAGFRARLQVRDGNAEGARAAAAITEKDDTNCEALTALADWRLRRGQIDPAVVPAQVVATQCADRIDGYVLLANAYAKAGRVPAIERVFREGIETHAQNPRLTALFADWLLSRDRGASAIAAARRLSVVAPSRESSWRLLASVCRRADNPVCEGDANRGLAKAQNTYQIDPAPGMRPADPLFGRTWR